jgi:preprotein translocase subunit YajC
MANTVFPLLQAAPSSTGSLLTTFIPFGLVILIFYFLIIRPQNKKQKQMEKMLTALKKGDKVVTIGGIHGVIQSVKDGGTVVVKVDESCKLEFSRSAIASVVAEPAKDEKAGKKEEKKVEKKEAASLPESEAAAEEQK